MPRLTVNDLQRQSWLLVDGATDDDIVSASAGGIRVMAVALNHTGAAGVITITDAATAGAIDLRLRCVDGDSAHVSFAPYGWRVSAISTVTTGSAQIFYILDE